MSKLEIEVLTAALPVLNDESFQSLQHRIQERQLMIREGRHPQQGFRALLGQKGRVMNFEERFEALQHLIQDYRQVVDTLEKHHGAYHQFFITLKHTVKEAIAEKCERIIQAEQKRLEKQTRAQHRQKPALLDIVKRQQDQLTRSIRLLGQAAFVLLRKVDLFATSLDKLAEDQKLQETVLGDLLEDLADYRDVYELQKEIDQIERDIAEMADIALNFEEIMRDYLGPFQSLIEQAVTVDQDLFKAAEDIKNATASLLNDNFETIAALRLEKADNTLLEFLIRSQLSRDWLVNALTRIQTSSLSPSLDLQQLMSQFPTLVTVEHSTSPAHSGDRSQVTVSHPTYQDPLPSQHPSSPPVATDPGQPPNPNRQDVSIHQAIENIQTYVTVCLSEDRTGSDTTGLSSTPEPQVLDVPITYEPLQIYLMRGCWLEADVETKRILLELTHQSRQGYLTELSIAKIPIEDLNILDHLWVNHSQGRFGFSVQKALWQADYGQSGSYTREVSEKFSDRVGWRQNGEWIPYNSLQFNIAAPMGHLPCVWAGTTIQKGTFRFVFGSLSALFLQLES